MSSHTEKSNQLLLGDNLARLRELPDGLANLIYADPPYASGRDYKARDRTVAFTDVWQWDEVAQEALKEIETQRSDIAAVLNGLGVALKFGPLLSYLVSLALRLNEMYRVLAPSGSLYVHCDPTAGHYLKVILDVIFGASQWRNEIVWRYRSGGRSDRFFARKHDLILWYSKTDTWTFNGDSIAVPRNGCQECGTVLVKRNNLKREVDHDGRVYRTIRSAGKIYRYYDDEPVTPDDVWLGIGHLQQKDPERTGYPTQKPESLLERVILVGTNEQDLVLDPYCGSGTTLSVAQRLGRRWIGIDNNEHALAITSERIKLG